MTITSGDQSVTLTPAELGKAARQVELPAMKGPGVEKPSIPEADEQCAVMLKARKIISAQRDKTKTALESLLTLLNEKSVRCYEHNGFMFTVKNKAEVKIKELGSVETQEGGE